jgi:hypothetical protein
MVMNKFAREVQKLEMEMRGWRLPQRSQDSQLVDGKPAMQ